MTVYKLSNHFPTASLSIIVKDDKILAELNDEHCIKAMQGNVWQVMEIAGYICSNLGHLEFSEQVKKNLAVASQKIYASIVAKRQGLTDPMLYENTDKKARKNFLFSRSKRSKPAFLAMIYGEIDKVYPKDVRGIMVKLRCSSAYAKRVLEHPYLGEDLKKGRDFVGAARYQARKKILPKKSWFEGLDKTMVRFVQKKCRSFPSIAIENVFSGITIHVDDIHAYINKPVKIVRLRIVNGRQHARLLLKEDLNNNDIMMAIEDGWRMLNNVTPNERTRAACIAAHEAGINAYTYKRNYTNQPCPPNKFMFSIPGLTYLDTTDKIREEGQKMHHCVGGYADLATKGELYIYHYEDKDGKATIAVNPDGTVQQCYSECNKTTFTSMKCIVLVQTAIKENSWIPSGV
jgi:hypothetical protein